MPQGHRGELQDQYECLKLWFNIQNNSKINLFKLQRPKLLNSEQTLKLPIPTSFWAKWISITVFFSFWSSWCKGNHVHTVSNWGVFPSLHSLFRNLDLSVILPVSFPIPSFLLFVLFCVYVCFMLNKCLSMTRCSFSCSFKVKSLLSWYVP